MSTSKQFGIPDGLPPILKLLLDQQAIHSVAEVVTEGSATTPRNGLA